VPVKETAVATVFVTGASRGIGLEFVKQYAADGWRVFACCRDPEGASSLKPLAADSGGRVRVFRLDVRDMDRIRGLARELEGEAIDILINNAGIYGPRHQPLGQVDPDTWLEVLRVNAVAPLKVAEAFLDHVARSERKTLAFVSSLMGSIGDNSSGGYYPYRTSKAALNMAAKGLAVDLKSRGILSVALNPGWVKTDMGGESAPLGVQESVAGIRAVLAKLRPEDSGSFLDYDGDSLPW
jgi:NAD(P)-dependent dehydrogenase (short-subunit alcohol dehydrogenase family)